MSLSRVLPPHWSEVIDRLHNAIRTALDAAHSQEQRFSLAPTTDEVVPTVADEVVQRLNQRLEAMQACCDRAAQTQREAEEVIAETADRLVDFLSQLNPTSEKLAEGGARAVS